MNIKFTMHNNTLDNLINNLEKACGTKIKPDNVYIPKLKLDIVFVFAVKTKSHD
jgi:hypothetical protein